MITSSNRAASAQALSVSRNAPPSSPTVKRWSGTEDARARS
jgi:hypothetical protein